MIDFVLGLALAAMLVRGWMRGMVREAFDLIATKFWITAGTICRPITRIAA